MPYISHAMARCYNEAVKKIGGGSQAPPTSSNNTRTTRSMPARHPQVQQYAEEAVSDAYHQQTTMRKMLFVQSLLQSQMSQMINTNSAESLVDGNAAGKKLFAEYKIDNSLVHYSGSKHKILGAKRISNANLSTAVHVYSRADQNPLSSLYLKVVRHLGRKHPYVVHTLDLFYDAEKVYIFQEFCTGGNVRQYLEKKGVLSEPLAISWAKDFYKALDFLGDQAIAHRDLKPEHLVVQRYESSSDPCLKLTGFKRALIYWDTAAVDILYCPCQPTEQTPADNGATNFQPLEMYGNPQTEQYDPVLADQWSYGANVFFMLSRKYPLSSGTPVEQLEAEVGRNVAALSGVSEHGKAFLAALLRINANNRMPFDFVVTHPWLTGKQTVSSLVISL